jgi:MFS transporter, ACDE family, multidrug resistance protein
MRTRGPSGSVATGAPPKALIFAITATGIMANPLISPAIPDLIDDFDVSPGLAGLLIAAGTLPGIVMAPVIGLLADRYGRRNVLVPCLIVFGLSGVAAAAAPSYAVLLLCRLFQGIGSAGLVNLAVVIIGDHWEGVDRARLLGQNAAVLTIGLAVLPPLGGRLTDLGTWRLAFAPYALGLVTAAVLWRRLPDTRPGVEQTIRAQLREAMVYVRTRTVLGTIGLGFVTFMLIFGLFLTALPLHLEDEFGLSASTIGLVLSIPALTSTLAALLLGRLQVRFGRRRMLLAGSTIFAVSFAVIGGAPTLWLLVLGGLVYGFGEGMVFPTLQDLVAGAAPDSSRGAVVAIWVGGSRAGQTIGPLLAGLGITALGTGATFIAGAAVAATMAFALALTR